MKKTTVTCIPRSSFTIYKLLFLAFSASPIYRSLRRNHSHPEDLQILFSVTVSDVSRRLIRGQGNFVLFQMRSPHFSDRIDRRDEYHLSSRLAEMAAWKVRRKALCDSSVLRIVRIACAQGDGGSKSVAGKESATRKRIA